MNEDVTKAVFCVVLLGIVATAIVLTQHAMHTQTIVSAVSANTVTPPGISATSPSSSVYATQNASPAGSGSPVQGDLGPVSAVPYQTGAGWTIN